MKLKLEFPESFREEVMDMLIMHISNALMSDQDTCVSMVECGMRGIHDMTDEELMEEWENWCATDGNTTYDAMLRYKANIEFEKEVLDEQQSDLNPETID
jgi:hypothetical protein